MTTSTQLTLEYVKQQFDDWRVHKKPGSNIPEPLWKLVQQLGPLLRTVRYGATC